MAKFDPLITVRGIQRQIFKTLCRPWQQVSVEQQLHAPSSNIVMISSPIWSKSAGTLICAAIKPNRLIREDSGALSAITYEGIGTV
ncbi:MAG: hypothetical protein P4L55_23035 [Syntrophobacteraceae bacterium]|nr:hypothetical protein [Syntrophobacteraceae bacterium]